MRIENNSTFPSSLQEKVGYMIQEVVAPTDLENTFNEKQQQVGEKELIELVDRGNLAVKKLDTRLQFSIHKETHQVLVKLVDTQTNEVVKEIPPEKMVDLIYNLCQQMGIFIDTKLG